MAQGRLSAGGFLHFYSLDFSVRWFFPHEQHFCPSLLLQGPRYCFKFHESSFVVVQQFIFFFPKLEALFLHPVVISVGIFTSLFKTVFL